MLSRRIAAYAATRSTVRTSPIGARAFVRTYAQPAEGASTKPPIALYGIDGTYATALVSQLRCGKQAKRTLRCCSRYLPTPASGEDASSAG